MISYLDKYYFPTEQLIRYKILLKLMEMIQSMNRNKMPKNKYPHIALAPETYNKLKSMGKMGDTFDKIVGDLLSQREGITK